MANDPYGLLASGLPPEIAADAQKISRQQLIAQALMQQSSQPLGMRPAGRMQAAPHWLEGAAKLAQAYAARRGLDSADQQSAALGQRYQQGLASEVQRIAAMRHGVPIPPDPQEVQQSADQGTPAPQTGSTGDPRAAVMAALTSQYPTVRKMGELDYTHMKKQDEPYTLKPEEVRYGANGEVLNVGAPKVDPDKHFKVGDIQTVIDGEQSVVREYQKDGTWKEIGRGPRFQKQVEAATQPQQAVTPVTIQDPNDPNGTIVIDGRTRAVLGKGPKLSETGKSNAKRQIAMQGVGETIERARDLLTGKAGGDLPTGSGVGTAVDYVGSIFGMTPKGAKEADQLRVAGGALVQKVPRFEGPQSDKDVGYYKEVAGRVGDSSLPIDRRLAALEEVEAIWGQFESGKKNGFFRVSGPGAAAPAAPAAQKSGPPKVRVVDW